MVAARMVLVHKQRDPQGGRDALRTFVGVKPASKGSRVARSVNRPRGRGGLP